MTLKIAIQKSGRLHTHSMELLAECGIDIDAGPNKLRAKADNFPIEIFFLRDDDIPQYVADGVVDLGIVGQNTFLEKNKPARVIEKLGFGKCRLSIAVPKTANYTGLTWLNNKKIATSYPFLVQNFLQKNQLSAAIHEISGSVEIAPSIGLAEAICDLVSSGSTLFTNNLEEKETILHSEALLIGQPHIAAAQQTLVDKFTFRLHAVRQAKHYKYILLNAPNEQIEKICGLLPGIKSPTIIALVKENWSSVHAVIHENDFWNIIETLKAVGAEGILVSSIEKMIL